jgi:predicted flap endonuclease-1-like 5' DNA nuclease
MPAEKRKNLHGLIGLVALIAAQLFLLKKVEPVASWFYYCAWWPYILIIDSLIYRIKGNSLLMNRRGEFVVMVLWSVVIWTLFEAINLIMQNWYYVNVIPLRAVRWPGYALAYATVLPGLFETAELLEALGLFKNSRVQPRTISPSFTRTLFALGVASLALVFLFPAYCYPLIWGAFTFILEPINYRHGTKSILRDGERGSIRTLCLLLTAGLVCGMLWEFWNFWASTKWVYTVPFFEELKLFEMPLLGFLGFPPFTVECYSIYNFISLFRHQRGWEEDSYGLNRHKKVHFFLMVMTVVTGIFFCAITFHAMDTKTVNSYWSSVADLQGIPPAAADLLASSGIRTPGALLAVSYSRADRERLAQRLSVPVADIESWRHYAELSELKGMGARNATMLIQAGIKDSISLAAQDPATLHARLVRDHAVSDGNHPFPPRKAILRIWIGEARKMTGA